MTSPTPPRFLCDQEDIEECASDRGAPCVAIAHSRRRVSQRFATAKVLGPRKVLPPAQRVGLCLIGTEGFFFVALSAEEALPFIVPPPFFR